MIMLPVLKHMLQGNPLSDLHVSLSVCMCLCPCEFACVPVCLRHSALKRNLSPYAEYLPLLEINNANVCVILPCPAWAGPSPTWGGPEPAAARATERRAGPHHGSGRPAPAPGTCRGSDAGARHCRGTGGVTAIQTQAVGPGGEPGSRKGRCRCPARAAFDVEAGGRRVAGTCECVPTNQPPRARAHTHTHTPWLLRRSSRRAGRSGLRGTRAKPPRQSRRNQADPSGPGRLTLRR